MSWQETKQVEGNTEREADLDPNGPIAIQPRGISEALPPRDVLRSPKTGTVLEMFLKGSKLCNQPPVLGPKFSIFSWLLEDTGMSPYAGLCVEP